MAEFRGGKGGFGGITTMSQDQRQGRYFPHTNVSIINIYRTDEVAVKCLDCGMEWLHPRLEPKAPKECK